MQFQSINEVLYKVLSRYSNLTRYCFTLLFIVFCCAVWLFLWYVPLIQTVQFYKQKILIEKRNFDEIRSGFNPFDLKRIINNLEKEIDKNQLKLHIQTLNKRVAFIMHLAQDNYLTLNSCVIKKRIKVHNGFFYPFDFVISGNFYRILDFFRKLSELDDAIKCNKIKMNNKENLIIQCNLSLLFFCHSC